MQNYRIFRFDELDSTNNFVKQNLANQPIICIADSQTAGRGRNGKVWQSPPQKNLYCSIGIPWHYPNKLSGLSLVMALAVIKTFKSFNLDNMQAKWPNDVLYQGKKIAGILIEVVTNTIPWRLVIGVGININAIDSDIQLDRTWVSAAQILGYELNRELVLQEFIKTSDNYIQTFQDYGLEPFISEWNQYDYLYEKKISLNHYNMVYTGICKGITTKGELSLQLNNGEVINLISGEIVLKES